MLGMKRVESSGKIWRIAYRKNGICGLVDTRYHNPGRPSEKNLSIEKNINDFKQKINYLK